MATTMEQNAETLHQVDGVLDTLGDMTGTMVTNAENTGNEIRSQTEMAKGINNHMDETNTGINKATGKLQKVQKVTKANIIPWVLIILFLVIGVVFFVLAAVKQ